MMEIKIGEVGRIVTGPNSEQYVQVIDDSANSGGFLVLTAKAPDMREGFDGWVESAEALGRFFVEAGWEVDWSVSDRSINPQNAS